MLVLAVFFLLAPFFQQPQQPPPPPQPNSGRPAAVANRPSQYDTVAAEAGAALKPPLVLPPIIIASAGPHGGEVDMNIDFDSDGRIAHIEPTYGKQTLVKTASPAVKFLSVPAAAGRKGIALRVFLLGRNDRIKTVPIPYPSAAADAKITGTVVAVAFVSPQGSVTEVNPLSGNPLLRASAHDAVMQWTFPPVARGSARTESYAIVAINFTADSDEGSLVDLSN